MHALCSLLHVTDGPVPNSHGSNVESSLECEGKTITLVYNMYIPHMYIHVHVCNFIKYNVNHGSTGHRIQIYVYIHVTLYKIRTYNVMHTLIDTLFNILCSM